MLPESLNNYRSPITTNPVPTFETLDFMWVGIADHDKSSRSIAAIAVTHILRWKKIILQVKVP